MSRMISFHFGKKLEGLRKTLVIKMSFMLTYVLSRNYIIRQITQLIAPHIFCRKVMKVRFAVGGVLFFVLYRL